MYLGTSRARRITSCALAARLSSDMQVIQFELISPPYSTTPIPILNNFLGRFDIIQQCWRLDSADRPRFEQLLGMLEDISSEESRL